MISDKLSILIDRLRSLQFSKLILYIFNKKRLNLKEDLEKHILHINT
jgi:hypothetical protein